MAIKDKEVYRGEVIKQVRGIVGIFDKFFEQERFDNIIEIGSGNGVFSIYFADKAKVMNSQFITYDIRQIKPEIKKEIISRGATVVTCDVTENTDIERIIKSKGRCLILNDGGFKVPEFHRFAPVLKKGDVMMSHDYYKGRKETSGGTVVISEVVDAIKENNLKIIYEKLFDSALWLCVRA